MRVVDEVKRSNTEDPAKDGEKSEKDRENLPQRRGENLRQKSRRGTPALLYKFWLFAFVPGIVS
jgi:hypothetical protein